MKPINHNFAISFTSFATSAALAFPASAATFSGMSNGGPALFRYEANGELRQLNRTAGMLQATSELLPGTFELVQARLSVPGFTVSDSLSIANPSTFQTKTYAISMVISPFSISYSGPPMTLTPNAGIFKYEHPDSFTMIPFNFEGSYTITGPTEAVSGTFSIMPDYQSLVESGEVNTGAFPNQISWRRQNPLSLVRPDADPTGTLFSRTVDGETVTIAFSLFSAPSISPVTLIPEPGSLALGGIALAFCAAGRKRTRD